MAGLTTSTLLKELITKRFGRGKYKIPKFKFAKTNKGKKIHILPKNGINSLSLCVISCKKEEDSDDYQNKDICKTCQKEYWKAIRSSSFRLFCM